MRVQIAQTVFMALVLASQSAQSATILTGSAKFDSGGGIGDLLQVGRIDDGGDGTATISDGEVLTLGSGTDPDELVGRPKIDVGEGATGLVVIEGAGTKVDLIGTTSGSKLEVGHETDGDGTIIIQDSAEVNLVGGPRVDERENVFVQTGEDGGKGLVRVDNAKLTLEGNALVGLLTGTPFGDGRMEIVNGADVSVTANGPNGFRSAAYTIIGSGSFSSGENGPSTGALLVDDASLSFHAEQADTVVTIGSRGGTGTATLTNGATVTLTGGEEGTRVGIGSQGAGNGTLTVENSSTLTLDGPLAFLGVADENSPDGFKDSGNGTGRFFVRDAGQVSINGSDIDRVTVRVGADTPDAGEANLALANISGTGSLVETNGIVQVGQSGGDGSTTAILTIEEGGALTANEIRITEGGILTGDGGTITGTTVVSSGGILAAGSSPGQMNFMGDLIIDGGIVQWEIGAGGVSDFWNLSGDLMVTSMFDLHISFLDGYVPGLGESFDLFDPSRLAGEFFGLADISVFGLGAGLGLAFDTRSGFSVASAPSVVPLPASAWLLIAALFGLGALRSRSQVAA